MPILLQTLPDGTRVVVPSGSLVYLRGDPGMGTETRTARVQDTAEVVLGEPVDVIFELEDTGEPVGPEEPVLPLEEIAKTTIAEETPWYKTPAFVGGVLSVVVFSFLAYLQSRAQARLG